MKPKLAGVPSVASTSAPVAKAPIPAKTPVAKAQPVAAPVVAKRSSKSLIPNIVTPPSPTKSAPESSPSVPAKTKAQAKTKTKRFSTPTEAIAGRAAAEHRREVAETSAIPDKPVHPAPEAPRKARPAPRIPPLLFEDDDVPALKPVASGPRFALGRGAVIASAAPAASIALPDTYGTGKLMLTARDPLWLHAQWDFSPEQLQVYRSFGARGVELRVFFDQPGGRIADQIAIPAGTRSWFVRVGQANTPFAAELGYTDAGGLWRTFATSGVARTPPEAPPVGIASDDEFQTIAVDVPFSKILAEVKEAATTSPELAEVLVELRAEGFTELPALEPSVGPALGSVAEAPPWTPVQERALAEVLRIDQDRHVWVGSLDVTELVRRGLGVEAGSVQAAEFSRPGAPSAEVAADLTVSSGAVPKPAGPRPGFWFNVNAELVIYGATEPDAALTVAGRPVKLRPDGTFSLRFALPDGDYELPVVAVSARTDDGRSAQLEFRRRTDYRGDVGTHPQDPALRAPRAENIV